MLFLLSNRLVRYELIWSASLVNGARSNIHLCNGLALYLLLLTSLNVILIRVQACYQYSNMNKLIQFKELQYYGRMLVYFCQLLLQEGNGGREGDWIVSCVVVAEQSKLFLILILGSHMQLAKEQGQAQMALPIPDPIPKLSSEQQASRRQRQADRHVAFEKNYPKNIFIPLIEHLGERGLQREYEACVGTRESFEGKNVVSLAQIHRVLSQEWFREGINLTALVSNMSNKILMNSKIKKKLFHLLLIRELFSLPRHDAKEFKKLVSRRASQVAQSQLPDDPLFDFPSALIYLLSVFAEGVSGVQRAAEGQELGGQVEQGKQYLQGDENSLESRARQRESSKQEYKHFISRIITGINSFPGDLGQLCDRIETVKATIHRRQVQIRDKYRLPAFVPEWGSFNTIVISRCLACKRNRNKLIYSLINQWILEFKEMATSLKGFVEPQSSDKEKEENYGFKPIILVQPPP